MGRRYRRKKSESLFTVIGDVIQISSKLSWWGALLVGLSTYALFAILLHGFIEHQIASQAGSQFHGIMEARFGKLLRITDWVGKACLIAGILVAIRNYFINVTATKSERSLASIISKMIGKEL